jgi:hypothetical protein
MAQNVSGLMLNIGKMLNTSLVQAQKDCSTPEFEQYRQAIGRVMGEMLTEVMNPIYSRHPKLKPSDWE